MTWTGKVFKGSVTLPADINLPDGTDVHVVIPDAPKPQAAGELKAGWFYQDFKEFVGVIKDGPADLAENHDHYAHGAAKRSNP